MRRGSGLAAICVIAVSILAACSEDEGDFADQLVRAYCGQMFACECESRVYFSDYDRCRGNIEQSFEFANTAANTNDFLYDPDCAAHIIATVKTAGCDYHAETVPDAGSCKLFYGTAEVDAACVSAHGGDSCAQGLRCNSPEGPGTCIVDVLSQRAHEGEPCDQLTCASTLVCDPDTVVCGPLGGSGEPCSGHAQCLSGYCPRGGCEPALLEGDDCSEAGACGRGLTCWSDQTCVVAQDSICGSWAPWP